MNEVDISEQELLEKYPSVLRELLVDRTRTAHDISKMRRDGVSVPHDFQRNIIWATSSYFAEKGEGFGERDEITEEKVTGWNRFLVQPRAVKEKVVQRQRSRDMAEVFTPGWVCNAQNNLVDDAWFGRSGVFNREFVNDQGEHCWEAVETPIAFDEEPSPKSTRSWQNYVRDLRLEITCGEAPYLVHRYDSVTGCPMADLCQRIGLLDRKLRVVSENTTTTRDWLKWAKEAVKATYGFEWQGDNLLLAREAILFSIIDYYKDKFKKKPQAKSLPEFAEIISWNIWQMDGLRQVLPYSCEENPQKDMLGNPMPCMACAKGQRHGHSGIKCLIRDWSKKGDAQIIEFESLIQDN